MPGLRWSTIVLVALLTAAALLAACAAQPDLASNGQTPANDTAVVNLVQPTDYYPLSYAGDEGWLLKGTLRADFNGDGNDETLYIIHKPQGHGDEGPWQAYVEDTAGHKTHIYAHYLNHQTLRAFVGATPKTADGNWDQLFLFNHGSVSISMYEVIYNGPDDVVWHELSHVLPLFWDEEEVR